MLTIRLFRTGRKNQPSFKVVVTEKHHAPSKGRFVEEVGVYNPLTKQRRIDGERVRYWISVGAKPSPTVHNMLIVEKVIEGSKIAKHRNKVGKAAAASPASKDEQAPVAEEKKPE